MRRWWRLRQKAKHCPHLRLTGIYGDEINAVGGYRLQCCECCSYLDGPVSLAWTRA